MKIKSFTGFVNINFENNSTFQRSFYSLAEMEAFVKLLEEGKIAEAMALPKFKGGSVR